jgi:dienelactone hydrolase
MQALRALAACSLAAAAFAAPCAATGPRLVVTPADGLIDAPVHMQVSGLPAGKRVTITTQTADAFGRTWRGKATLRADGRGRADPARMPSVAGTYRGRDAMGLFSSMVPAGWRGRVDTLGMAPAQVATVRLLVTADSRPLARATIVRRVSLPEVTVREATMATDGIVGHFCSAPSIVRRPAIVRIGGSEGGVPGVTGCSLLASHGYPTLALGYFDAPGLPPDLANIPLEYFQHALQWLALQPGVDKDKLVMMGVSRGGEGALLVASVYPELVHAAVGYVPSAYVFSGLPDFTKPAWTLHGQPVPYLDLRDLPTEAETIKVERIAGPIFLVGAVLDALWPSADFVSKIAERLRAHGRTDFSALTYYSAGHGVGFELPYLRAPTVGNSRGSRISLGGTPAGDARARGDSWPRLLAFLNRL